MTYPLSQSLHVDRAELLNEDTRDCAANLDLWSERSRSGASGGGRDEHNRPRQKFISLHDHSKSFAALLTPAFATQQV